MQAEIKIHVDQENKKVHINGEVSLKAILALLEGLDEDPSEYVIGQIMYVPDYPQVDPFQPYGPLPVPNYPTNPFNPWDSGPVYFTSTDGDKVEITFDNGVFKSVVVEEER